MQRQERTSNQIRPITITRHYTEYAEGSVLIEFGQTKVLCNASVVEGVPRFLKGEGQGWITAEYSMLPRSTHTRMNRESAQGKQGGRTLEIQRLIARSLRAAVDLKALGENTITIDCDVIQADGGTRTAAITGGCVALVDALNHMRNEGLIKVNPLKHLIAAVSIGVLQEDILLDLEYKEDSIAGTDMNVVMTESGQLIEIQGTAEGEPFSFEQLQQMLELAKHGIRELVNIQKQALL